MRVAKFRWKLFKNESCLGVLTLEEVEAITGMKKKNIPNYADTGAIYKKTFRVEKVEEMEDFCYAWNRATSLLLRQKRA